MGARSSSAGERDRPCHSRPTLRPTSSPFLLRPYSQLAAESQPPAQPAGRRGRQAPPRGPAENSTLTQLNLSCNALEFDAATTTRQIVATSTALRNLDLSCNLLSEEAGRLLREGLQQNGTLQSLDLRQNQMSLDTVAAVDEVCKRNQLEYDKQRRDVREKLRALAKANTAARRRTPKVKYVVCRMSPVDSAGGSSGLFGRRSSSAATCSWVAMRDAHGHWWVEPYYRCMPLPASNCGHFRQAVAPQIAWLRTMQDRERSAASPPTCVGCTATSTRRASTWRTSTTSGTPRPAATRSSRRGSAHAPTPLSTRAAPSIRLRNTGALCCCLFVGACCSRRRPKRARLHDDVELTSSRDGASDDVKHLATIRRNGVGAARTILCLCDAADIQPVDHVSRSSPRSAPSAPFSNCCARPGELPASKPTAA